MKKLSILIAGMLVSIGVSASYIYTPQPRVHVPVAPITVAVSSVAAQALPANGSRTGLECTNTGTTTIYLYQGGWAASAVAGMGTAIPPGAMWYADDYNFTQGLISAVASGVASTMSCQEYQ